MIEPEPPLSRRALREARAKGAKGSGSAASAPVPPTDPAPTDPAPTDPAPTDPAPTEATVLLAAPTEADATGSAATPGETDPSAARGLGAFVARHPRAVLTTALSVGFLLLATGALFAGVSVGSANAVVAGPVATATPTPDPRPVPASVAGPSRLRTCSIDAIAQDERLSTLFGSVVNTATGELLWDRQAATPARTASVLKILTGAVALSVLGPDYRLVTRVVAGSSPGSVVLIGGGDATLSRLPPGQESVYPGAPKLADLAAQTVAAYAAANPDAPGITEVVLDATYWNTGDRWDSSWDRSLQTIGYNSEVTALQVDGDRDDPRREMSPRSTDPVGRAGAAFATALAEAGNTEGVPTLSYGSAVSSTVLAQVQSQPVSALVTYMIDTSDNTVAEMLSRVSSRVAGLDGSAASLTRTFVGALNIYGVPTAGISIRDGSGLSDLNGVPAQYVAELLVLVNDGGQNLSIITNALAVSGVSGSLASRFTGANAIARGAVLGKTGWIGTARTLAGIVRAADGSVLTFSFYAIRDNVSENTREALDTLATGVFSCGDNLSNN